MSLKHIFLIKESTDEMVSESEIIQCIKNVIQARGPRDSGALGHRIDELEIAFNEWINHLHANNGQPDPHTRMVGEPTE